MSRNTDFIPVPLGRRCSVEWVPSDLVLTHTRHKQFPLFAWGLAFSCAGAYFAARCRSLRRMVIAIERLPRVSIGSAVEYLYRRAAAGEVNPSVWGVFSGVVACEGSTLATAAGSAAVALRTSAGRTGAPASSQWCAPAHLPRSQVSGVMEAKGWRPPRGS